MLVKTYEDLETDAFERVARLEAQLRKASGIIRVGLQQYTWRVVRVHEYEKKGQHRQHKKHKHLVLCPAAVFYDRFFHYFLLSKSRRHKSPYNVLVVS